MYRLILAAAAAGFAFLAVADANATDIGGYYPARDRAALDKLFVASTARDWTGFYAGINGGYGFGPDVRGFSGGGQLGYNYQLDRKWVVGAEADIQYNPQPAWWGTVRGRAGYLVMPDLLVYGTGGLAYQLNSPPFNTHGNTVGWTAGGGIEWAFTGNWSAKAEYLYVAPGGGQDANVARLGLNYKF